MGIFIVWILFSVLIGLIGKGKKIGFGLSFLWSILLSPLIGLIIVLVSDNKNANGKPPTHMLHRELGEKAEYKGYFKDARDHYMDSLYHLENDYKSRKLTKFVAQKRQKLIIQIKGKIAKLKEKEP